MTQKNNYTQWNVMKFTYIYIYIYTANTFFSHDVCSGPLYSDIRIWNWCSHIKPHLDKLRPVKLSYDTTGFKFQESEGLVFFRSMYVFFHVRDVKRKENVHNIRHFKVFVPSKIFTDSFHQSLTCLLLNQWMSLLHQTNFIRRCASHADGPHVVIGD